MSDFDTFKSKPDRSDMDDTSCRYGACDNEATHVIAYRRPSEWVPYCQKHNDELKGQPRAQNSEGLV